MAKYKGQARTGITMYMSAVMLALALILTPTSATASPVGITSNVNSLSKLAGREPEPQYIMQVNYYSDTSCNNFINSVQVSYDAEGTCVGYYMYAAYSANIANCDADACQVQFWGGTGCSNGWGSVLGTSTWNGGGSNCVKSKNGDGVWFQSFVPYAMFDS